MTEVFNTLKLFCDIGQVQATVLVEAGADLRDVFMDIQQNLVEVVKNGQQIKSGKLKGKLRQNGEINLELEMVEQIS